MTTHEIVDMETGNLVVWKATEADILAFVRHMVAAQGTEVAQTWILSREDDEDGELIAEGQALIKLAEREASAA